jgi:hypothetical protein
VRITERTHVRFLEGRIALVGLLVVAVSACGGGSTGGKAVTSSRPPSENASAGHLSLSSSLANDETLRKPTTWSVTVHGAPVDHVDFFIDGRKRWTENNPPYFFNDDDQFLEPWLLSPGKHVLSAQATAATGETAVATDNVQMGPAPVAPRELAGTFTRTVTQSDLDRTAKDPGRQADASLPPGDWTMKLDHGLFTFDDPNGSGGGEAFSATRVCPEFGWHLTCEDSSSLEGCRSWQRRTRRSSATMSWL